jgi:hypothetical protein
VKKLLLVIVLICAVFVTVERQKLFLRDPLANVMRDGAKESGAQVFINYANDVLIENDNAPMYVLVVQHGQHAGAPRELKCVHWMMCLADADPVPLLVPMKGQVGEMTNRLVEFRDEQGRDVKVTLR